MYPAELLGRIGRIGRIGLARGLSLARGLGGGLGPVRPGDLAEDRLLRQPPAQLLDLAAEAWRTDSDQIAPR